MQTITMSANLAFISVNLITSVEVVWLPHNIHIDSKYNEMNLQGWEFHYYHDMCKCVYDKLFLPD